MQANCRCAINVDCIHFLRSLPQGRRAQVLATRAYLDVLYGTALQAAPASHTTLVDKTPANARVVDFLREVYPKAPLIILRRHPAAIAWSHAETFFRRHGTSPRRTSHSERNHSPRIGHSTRSESVCVVDYEQLVLNPAQQMDRIWSFLGLPSCPEAIQYGKVPLDGPGDPTEVERHQQPKSDTIGPLENPFSSSPSGSKKSSRKQLGSHPSC